jgi:hypothetical protein
MTGAGSANVAYALESSFLGGVGGSPTYRRPGSNLTVDTLSIDTFLQRIRAPGSRESIRSVSQRFEGALTVSFNLGSGQFNELLFNGTDGSGNDVFEPGLVPSAEWYLGVDFESGGSITTAERVAKGWVCVQATISYSEGDLVTVTLDGIYGDEATNTSLTPGTIATPGTEADFYEVDLQVDGAVQTKLQSATLSMDSLARFERGASRTPVAAVAGPATTTLDVEARFSGTEQLELAYGGAGATAPQDGGASVGGRFTVSPNGSTVADYALANMSPATYDWSDLVTADTSLTESVTFQVNGVSQTAGGPT